ncbi:MAG: DUF401 family protein [Spirochaetes bacterium]|nr:DUF401 family protein [Spirochaetota bacterium]
MNFLLTTPYMARVLISLFVILIINKIFKKLWFSVLIGTFCLALWTGHSFQEIYSISLQKAGSLNNILLMVIIFQVIWLSSQMSASGLMREMVSHVKSIVSKRASMAILPAMIGLLPMPGGAIFSAPLVDDCDTDKKVDPLLKTKINYWFRHVWEYWWPLYPGVLLAVDITGLPILTFMVLQLPLSIISVLAGYLFLLRKVNSRTDKGNNFRMDALKKVISSIQPIIIIVSIYTFIKLFFPAISSINKYFPMIIGIFFAQIFLQIQRPQSLEVWKKIIFSKKLLTMALIVLLVRIFGAFIESRLSNGILLMDLMRGELNSWGFPYILIIMLVPFISGMTTGVAIGFVGASFPIVMSLLGDAPALNELLATTVLAYASGYMGMILSPVHICLIVTNEHFKTGLTDSLVRLIKPALVMLGSALLYYLILR